MRIWHLLLAVFLSGIGFFLIRSAPDPYLYGLRWLLLYLFGGAILVLVVATYSTLVFRFAGRPIQHVFAWAERQQGVVAPIALLAATLVTTIFLLAVPVAAILLAQHAIRGLLQGM